MQWLHLVLNAFTPSAISWSLLIHIINWSTFDKHLIVNIFTTLYEQLKQNAYHKAYHHWVLNKITIKYITDCKIILNHVLIRTISVFVLSCLINFVLVHCDYYFYLDRLFVLEDYNLDISNRGRGCCFLESVDCSYHCAADDIKGVT